MYIYIYIHRKYFIYAYVDSHIYNIYIIYISWSCRYAWSFLVKPSISYGVIFYEQYALFWVCVCRCSKTEDSQMCTRSSINPAWDFSGYSMFRYTHVHCDVHRTPVFWSSSKIPSTIYMSHNLFFDHRPIWEWTDICVVLPAWHMCVCAWCNIYI